MSTQEQLSWSELAELTHETQVAKFNWCMCEDNEGQENPYSDCPKTELQLKTPKQLAREARDQRNTSKTNEEFDYWHTVMQYWINRLKTGENK